MTKPDENTTPTSRTFWLGIVAVLVPTFVTGLVSFGYTVLDTKRKDELALVRNQIANLYGPIYAQSLTGVSLWQNLIKPYEPNFDGQMPPTKDQILVWRMVINNVVKPFNERIEKTLLESGEIIRCQAVRDSLHDLFSYAESVKVLSATWEKMDDATREIGLTKERNLPALHYPTKLTEAIKAELDRLHDRETRLDDGFLGLWLSNSKDSDCPVESQGTSAAVSARADTSDKTN